MQELAWGSNKARIWLNELPSWDYEVTHVVEHHLPAYGMHSGGVRCVAVERVRYVAQIMYGALGATFVPEPREDLLVQVLVSTDQGQLHQGPLVARSETARLGFPNEYVKCLLNGVIQSEYTQLLGTGTLSFCRAIHGEVGSSINFFEIVSRTVVRLLCLNAVPFSDEDLLAFLQQKH